jgi:hypothetical protein
MIAVAGAYFRTFEQLLQKPPPISSPRTTAPNKRYAGFEASCHITFPLRGHTIVTRSYSVKSYPFKLSVKDYLIIRQKLQISNLLLYSK